MQHVRKVRVVCFYTEGIQSYRKASNNFYSHYIELRALIHLFSDCVCVRACLCMYTYAYMYIYDDIYYIYLNSVLLLPIQQTNFYCSYIETIKVGFACI